MPALPTRRQIRIKPSGIEVLPDSTYEAAYVAFRLALQGHLGEGVACWVEADDIDIITYAGATGGAGQATGTARFRTLSEDGKRLAPKRLCRWRASWKTEAPDNLPQTVLDSSTITE